VNCLGEGSPSRRSIMATSTSLARAGVGALVEVPRRMPNAAAVAPDITSAPAKPTRVGPFDSKPVIDINPDIAWIMPSKAAVARCGPT